MGQAEYDRLSAKFDKVNAGSPVDTKKPHAWIQWKGTNVCADIRCECGALGHIDADFAYTVRCANCGRLYGLDAHVTMVPLTEEEGAVGCEPVLTAGDEDAPVTWSPPLPGPG